MQVAARARAEKRAKIKRLENRLDAHVEKAESMKPGTSGRDRHYSIAEITRKELREISH
jgi:hypothetical protein